MKRTGTFIIGLRRWTALSAILLLMAFSQVTDFTKQDFEKLKPLSGLWVSKRANGDIYEQWARSSDSELTGRSYKMMKTDTMLLESMKLYHRGGEIVFAPVAARQNNEKEVLFKLRSIAGNEFVFENLQHDFPQRIVYRLISRDSLHAYIEGQVQAKNKRIDYPYSRIH
ncbi:DUF6265 family protein [Dyadobacter pollutisoli]|jgi:hypothetical protein|uniref:DUF6265 family protein n=1 Tax=Dyadobacter pollutisoli TaxID=2910158 RepID=A0A9E8NAG4_9BACT|nr:DUF6265 family protein [Dyadobacter pollutisoli]WAC12935.1 DUF6265 family protein [Dyadobacter pollutisoli]